MIMRFRFSKLMPKAVGLWLGVCAVLALPPVEAMSAATVPLARGALIRDVARVTFEWPDPVDFTVDAHGNTVSIAFDRKANPEFGGMLSSLYPYVTHAEQAGDGKTVILTLDKAYRIRTFKSGAIGGIELLGVDPAAGRMVRGSEAAPHKEVAVEKPLPEKKLVAKKIDEIKKPEARLAKVEAPKLSVPNKPETQLVQKQKPLQQLAEKEDKQAAMFAKLAPAAGQAVAQSPKPAAVAPAVKSEPRSDVPKVALPTTQTTHDLGDSAPSPDAGRTLKENTVGVSTAEDSATLRFPFAERTAFAVFTRNHYLWIVLGKHVQLNLSEFANMEKTIISKPQLIKHSKATILQMALDDGVSVSVNKEDNTDNWAVLLTQKKRPLAAPLHVEVNTTPPAPAHVFISTLETADAITVTDPQIGDELLVMPLFKAGEGIARTREFIEFSLLATVQGVTVVKKADDVTMVQLRNGIRISTTKGASITPDLPAVEEKENTVDLQASQTLFPYDAWKVESSLQRKKVLKTSLAQVVESENVKDANSARLRMAQYYLSEGFAVEAIAMLDGINRTYPAFYRSSKLSALHGAANFLMERFPEAARDFSATELNNNKEVDYWRNMLADLLGSTAQSHDYLALNEDYISKYPPVFRQRLAIIAADRAIAGKDYNVALKILDTLHKDNLIASINAYSNFLVAKISIATGQEDAAKATLQKLAEDNKFPFVRARAEYTRIARDIEEGGDKEKSIEQLERLRLSWHGDGLELQVLSLLGDLYAEKKDYVNAMRIWNNGIQSFQNTAAAIDMAHKMDEAFVFMFSEGATDGLPPLEALSLYYEYRNFMPAGVKGNEMIERLADRLVGVDLLEQAAVLLDHQMHAQTEKEQRSRLGARLAATYLMNRQPEKALLALRDSVYGENSASLRALRNRLTADAMIQLGQSDKALQTLGQDDTPDAEHLRMTLYWKEKDWPNLISSVETMLKNRKDITAPVTLDESEFLLKLALAYVFEDNREQIKYLRDYFGPLMADNPNRKLFEFVTADDVSPTPRNFNEVIEHLSQTRSFVNSYSARIQEAGLTTPAAEKK